MVSIKPRNVNVLVACEESQRVCSAFRELGFNAYSCDVLMCSGGHPEWHIMCDVSAVLPSGSCFFTCDGTPHFDVTWDMIIAHPPCTYMSKAGARWMYKDGQLDTNRFEKAIKARDFFMLLYDAKIRFIAIENPTPLRIIQLPQESQIIQPYQFGDPYSKRTCLWLRNLPNLQATYFTTQYQPWCPSNTSKHTKGAGGSRGIARNAKTRSKTFPGIAKAMAEQWGAYVIKEMNHEKLVD